MIYITQLIYLKQGMRDDFEAFEAIAMPLIEKYQGAIMLRIRPNDDTWVEGSSPIPDEVHLISFPTDSHMERFLADENRQKALFLKDQAIQSIVIIKGSKI